MIIITQQLSLGDEVSSSATKKVNTPRVSIGNRRRSSRSSLDAEQDREGGDRRDIEDGEEGDKDREDGEGDGESDIDIEMDTEDAQNDHAYTQPVFDNNESMVRHYFIHAINTFFFHFYRNFKKNCIIPAYFHLIFINLL